MSSYDRNQWCADIEGRFLEAPTGAISDTQAAILATITGV
jgi:hypothetical protein